MSEEKYWEAGMFTETATGATGSIETNGNIYFRGKYVGRIDPNGNVHDFGGAIVGYVHKDGSVTHAGGIPAGEVRGGGFVTDFGGRSMALGSVGAVLPLLLDNKEEAAPVSYRQSYYSQWSFPDWALNVPLLLCFGTLLVVGLMLLLRRSDSIWGFFSGTPFYFLLGATALCIVLCLLLRKTGLGGIFMVLGCVGAGAAALLYANYELGLAAFSALPLRLFDPDEFMHILGNDPPAAAVAALLDQLWGWLEDISPEVNNGYLFMVGQIIISMFNSMDSVIALILTVLLIVAALAVFILLLALCVAIPLLPAVLAVLIVSWPLRRALR